MSELVYPPDPLAPVLLGGTINLLAGAAGTGKSTFLAWLSKQLHTRTPLWGREWGTVPWQGIICADRSWHRSTIRWFELEGMAAIPAYSLQDDRGFKKARLRFKHQRVGVFEHCLQKLSPDGTGFFPLGSLVYVDPIALFLGGNLNDYDTCAVACSELRELCLERGITIIGTAHAGKQRNDPKERYMRLQDRIIGSMALFGYTDTQMYVASPEEVGKDYYAFLWHPHHAPASTFKFQRAEDGRFVPSGVLEDKRGRVSTEPVDDAIVVPAWLQTALGSSPKAFADLLQIATTLQVSRATLHRHLQELVAAGLLKRPRHGEYALISTH